MVENAQALPVVTIGENPVKLWGLAVPERVARIARASKLTSVDAVPAGAAVLSNAAFVWDPAWLRYIAGQPGTVLTLGGIPALAHGADKEQTQLIAQAMADAQPMPETAAVTVIVFEDGPTIENKQLRKRETPFLLPLCADAIRQAERASYFGAYKGVTDLLTKYLWPEWALVLTRISAKLHVTPNMVTAVGAAFCIAATVLFAQGDYWAGMAAGLVFMVLDTVDGKLARCTITSSYWGNIFDHGLDLVHPPFWWWFWATGLATWGLAYDDATFWWVQGAIQGGYVVQRLIEGAFIARFDGIHIHVWERFDSLFRLVTARRNPNMVILFVALLFARPDLGLIAVALWTAISCLVHLIRLVQALRRQARGGVVQSWIAQGQML